MSIKNFKVPKAPSDFKDRLESAARLEVKGLKDPTDSKEVQVLRDPREQLDPRDLKAQKVPPVLEAQQAQDPQLRPLW
jgi:hypothetical protein